MQVDYGNVNGKSEMNFQNNTVNISINNDGKQAVSANSAEAAAVNGNELIELLKAGDIFTGRIMELKNDMALLKMNGTGILLNARLQDNVNLSIDRNIMFQVKESIKGQMIIKPVDGEFINNSIVEKSLSGQNFPINDRNISIVNELMNNNMNLSRENILNINKYMNSFENAPMDTVVKLLKYNIPVTRENIQMYNDLKNDTGKFHTGINELSHQLSNAITEKPQEFYNLVLGLYEEENAFSKEAKTGAILQGTETGSNLPEANAAGNSASESENIAAGENINKNINDTINENANKNLNNNLNKNIDNDISKDISQPVAQNDEKVSFLDRPLSQIVGSEEASEIARSVLRADGKNSGEINTVKDLISTLTDTSQPYMKDFINNIFKSNDRVSQNIKKIIERTVKEAITIEPSEISEGNVNNFFKSTLAKMNLIEKFVRENDINNPKIFSQTENVKDSISFMNDFNQVMQFVQLPINFNGKQMDAQLYVYTNKKSINSNKEEKSAYLRLKMDNLGEVDIMVKLKGSHVSADFYAENKISKDIIESNADKLKVSLEKAGYILTNTFSIKEKKFDFEEDFVKEEEPFIDLKNHKIDMRI